MKNKKPDYKYYTLDQLYKAQKRINKEKYPDRLKEIETEIEDWLSNPRIKEELEKQKEERKYDTFWPRFWAGLIDGLLFYPFQFLTVYATTHFQSMVFATTVDQLGSWLYIAYVVLMHGTRGQTIGKIICKVKVYDISEKQLSMKQAVLRDSALIISNAIILSYIFTNLDTYYHVFLTEEIESIDAIPKWVLVFVFMNIIWFALEVFTMLTNSKRRALHDYIAGSVVMRI